MNKKPKKLADTSLKPGLKKSQEISKSIRPTTSVWDVIDKQPDIARKVIDTKKTIKAKKGTEKKSIEPLLKTQKALQEVVERKGKLYQLIQELEPKKKKLKKKRVTVPSVQEDLAYLPSPTLSQKPFDTLISKLKDSCISDRREEEVVKEIPVLQRDFVAAFSVKQEPSEPSPSPVPSAITNNNTASVEPTKTIKVDEMYDNLREEPELPWYELLSDLQPPIPVESNKEERKKEIAVEVPIRVESNKEERKNEIVVQSVEVRVEKDMIDDFKSNLKRAPDLVRQFVSLETVHSDQELIASHTDVIHYGLRLEAKILELIRMYNNYVEDLGNLD